VRGASSSRRLVQSVDFATSVEGQDLTLDSCDGRAYNVIVDVLRRTVERFRILRSPIEHTSRQDLVAAVATSANGESGHSQGDPGTRPLVGLCCPGKGGGDSASQLSVRDQRNLAALVGKEVRAWRE
jgi:hypothetical protein